LKFTTLSGEPGVAVELDRRTITDHRLRRLDLAHTIKPILINAGFTLEYKQSGEWYIHGLKNLAGSDWNVLTDRPSMIYKVPPGGARYPGSGATVVDTVHGGFEKASQLFERVVTENRDKELDRHTITKLLPKRFVAIRYGERSIIAEGSFAQGASRVVEDRQPDLLTGVSAMLIETFDLEVAKAALAHKDLPPDGWTTVAVSFELWPLKPWSNESLSATEREGIKRLAKRQRRAAAKAVEDEVAAFRAELEARQSA